MKSGKHIRAKIKDVGEHYIVLTKLIENVEADALIRIEDIEVVIADHNK